MTIENLDAKLIALEAAQTKAKENHLAVYTTMEYGEARQQTKNLFLSNPIIRDLFPSSWYRIDSRISTRSLVSALLKGKERLVAVNASGVTLLTRARELSSRGHLIAAVQNRKRAAKDEALLLVEGNPAANDYYRARRGRVMRFLRRNHCPSVILAGALREMTPISAAVRKLLVELDFLAERKQLQDDIDEFVSGAGTVFVDMRPHSLLRVTHAPVDELLELLDTLATCVEEVSTAEKLEAKCEFIEALIRRIEARERLEEERDQCLQMARQVEGELQADKKEALKILTRVKEQIRIEEVAIAEKRKETLASGLFLGTRELSVRKLREEITEISQCLDILRSMDPDVGFQALASSRESLRRLDRGESLRTLRAERDQQWWENQDIRARLGFRELEIQKLTESLAAASGDERAAIESELSEHRAAQADLETRAAPSKVALHEAEDAYQTALQPVLQNQVEMAVFCAPEIDLDSLRTVSDSDRDGKTNEAVLAAYENYQKELIHERAQKRWRMGINAVRCEEGEKQLAQSFELVETFLLALRADNDLRQFYLARIDLIDDALSKAKLRWQQYRDAKALVFYLNLSSDLYRQLLNIAHFIRGGRTGPDAMGNVRIVIMIEAGVRAGVELGFADLKAEVSITLSLAGTLAVVDSREMLFSHHLSIFLGAQANTRAGLPQIPAVRDVLPVPDVLIEASARCSANIYDVEGINLYDDEPHWAARWAHAIAKRVAMLRRVKLTRDGLETINGTWLEAQLQDLAADGQSSSWIRELSGQLKTEPRSLYFKARGFQMEASAQRTDGATPTERTLGSTSAGTFDLFSGDLKLGGLEEDSCTFIPVPPAVPEPTEEEEPPEPVEPEFKGLSIYHIYTPEGACEPREFVEVVKMGDASVATESISFSSAGTQNQSLASDKPDAFRDRRVLAQSMELNPTPTFTNTVSLPKRLDPSAGTTSAKDSTGSKGSTRTKDSTGAKGNPELETLKKTIRYRLELLEAKGEPSRLERLYVQAKTYKEQLDQKAAECEARLAEATAQLDQVEAEISRALASSEQSPALVQSTVAPIASTLAAMGGSSVGVGRAAVALGQSATTAYAAVQEDVSARVTALGLATNFPDKTHNIYTRWYKAPIVQLTPDGSALDWSQKRWTPQVHRGLNVRQFKLSLSQTIPIVPAISAFFKETITFSAESVQFEILGLHTFSYLKTLFVSFEHKRAKWDAYWALHKGEIWDLCEQVATPGTCAFTEVAQDALSDDAPKARAAAGFGALCWQLFNQRDNPFQSPTEEKILAALKPVAPRTHSATSLPALPAIVMPTIPTVRPPSGIVGLLAGYLSAVQEGLLASWGANSTSAVGSRITGRVRPLDLLSDVQVNLGRQRYIATSLAKKLPSAGVSRSSRDEQVEADAMSQVVIERSRFETSLSKELLRVAAGEVAPDYKSRVDRAEVLQEFVLEEMASLSVLDEMLWQVLQAGATSEEMGRVVRGGASPEDEEKVCAQVLQVILSLLEQRTLVPEPGVWKTQSTVGVSFMTRRSSKTKELDVAVAQYGRAISEATALGDVRSRVEQADRQRGMSLVVQALAPRLDAIRNLRQSIETWRGQRDELTSNRAANVACFLEVPLLREQNKISTALVLLHVRQRMLQLSEQRRVLSDALQEHQKFVARELAEEAVFQVTRRRAQRAISEHAVRERQQRAAALIQRNWRASGLQRMQNRMKSLPEALASYLALSAEGHRHDGLCFGQKKVLAPGASLPQYEVPNDPAPQTSPPAPS